MASLFRCLPAFGRRYAGNSFFLVAAIFLFAASTPASSADFSVAFLAKVESRPAVALNTQTGEFFVAYLERQSDVPNPLELRVRRFNAAGQMVGSIIEPLGSGTHSALGRPAIGYAENEDRIFVVVPAQTTDPTHCVGECGLGRFLDRNGNTQPGPNFMFEDGGTYHDGGIDDGVGSLQVAYNPQRGEFVVTMQRDVSSNLSVWAQKINAATTALGTPVLLASQGIHSLKSHSIAHANVATTTPAGGNYLFINHGFLGGLSMLDADLNFIPGPGALNWGEPQGGVMHADIAFGRVEGKDRWLMIWADENNCWPGFDPCPDFEFQQTGVWGTYINPLDPAGGANTPFPITKIWAHTGNDTSYKPRVTYNRDAETFYVVWREIPALHVNNDESRSHIRGARVDYFVEDNLAGALVPQPHPNYVLSDVTGTCPPTGPCLSLEDPTLPDVAASGFGAVAVWHSKYVANPSDLDVWGDFMYPPVPDNDTITSPLVLQSVEPPVEGTLVGSSVDANNTDCGSAAEEPDVWFFYEAPSDGTFFVNTCGSNDLYGGDTGMDTVLSLHRGDGAQFEGACNDDFDDGSVPDACEGRDAGNLRDSALALHINAGQNVYVRVSKYFASYGGRFLLNYDFNADADTDGDGIIDTLDNCVDVANGPQRDTDSDGFGNRCDGDFNNDCIVNPTDLGIFRTVFFDTGPGLDGDLNGDNVINPTDLGIMKTLFFLPPGPSGLPNICP